MLTADTDTPIRGRLVVAGRVVLASWFEGDIVCSELVIAPDGYVRGTVATRTLTVEGQIVGPIHAEAVHLASSAFIEGDVHHIMLEMAPGATLAGRAVRFKAIQLPAELLSLEARAPRELPGPAQRTPVRRLTSLPASGSMQCSASGRLLGLGG
jgi:cytoskeletal protein CcmA (bactofilin family)